MKYNFDEIIDRRGTGALKLEALQPRWGRTDLLPLWVADMDLATPPFIMDTIRKRCEHPILGYTSKPESYFTSIVNWLQKRHGWKVETSQISFIPGIVPGIAFAVKCFTGPGDKVLVMPPVYHPFFLVTKNEGRQVVYCPLTLQGGQYRIDFDLFRERVKGCKLFILCNPHNPGGRVWTPEELRRIAEICAENNVLIISDEIHADLTLPPHRHTPFASVSDQAAAISLTFMSPSKAFNMAGLGSAYAVIGNDSLRRRFRTFLDGSDLAEGHVFAYSTVEAAYTRGEEWLGQALAYLQGNIDYVDNYLREHIPAIKAIRPEASFLIFLDCRDLGLGQERLVDFFVDKAHLALNDGSMFGEGGTGFMRMNIACPRSVLIQAMGQLEKAYNDTLKQ